MGSGVAELAQWVGWTDVLALTGNPGTVITYICQIHPNETGTITVTGAPATKSPNN